MSEELAKLQDKKNEVLRSLGNKEKSEIEILKDKGCKASIEDGMLRPQFEYAQPIQKADQQRGTNRFEPTAGELGLINEKALGKLDGSELKASDVVALTIRAAAVDSPSDDDIIELPVLEFLAQDAKAVGLPIFLASEYDEKDHTRKASNTKGIVYDAYVKDNTLFYKAYFPKSTRNTPYIEDILNGLYTKTSVGFYINPVDYHCSACRIPMADKACPHQVGDYLPGGAKVKGVITKASRNAEISLVGVPARTESRVLSMSQDEDNIVDKEEQERLEALGQEALNSTFVGTNAGQVVLGTSVNAVGLGPSVIGTQAGEPNPAANTTAVGKNALGTCQGADMTAVGSNDTLLTSMELSPLEQLKAEMNKALSEAKEEIELLKAKLNTADRINTESTILDNTMADETSPEKKDDVSKDLGQIDVPALPDVGGAAEVKPAVDSHQTIEAPKHLDLKKEAEDALAKLDVIAKAVDEVLEAAKKDNKHLAILGFMTEIGTKLEKHFSDSNATVQSLVNKVSDLEDQVKSQAKEKTIEQALEAGKSPELSQVVSKSSANQALLNRLLIKE